MFDAHPRMRNNGVVVTYLTIGRAGSDVQIRICWGDRGCDWQTGLRARDSAKDQIATC
jgi:hypothetical protein